MPTPEGQNHTAGVRFAVAMAGQHRGSDAQPPTPTCYSFFVHRLVRHAGLVPALALMASCGRVGFDTTITAGTDADAALDAPPPSPLACTGTQTFGLGGDPGIAGTYGSADSALLEVPSDRVGCHYLITVDGAGGGRGNHDNPASNADGGNGGRISFLFVPDRAGALELVVGGAGTGLVGTGTLDDPEPGAGGGGSSQVSFVPLDETAIVLAVAGGGGGGGWAEVGSAGGGGNGECGGNADEGSTGGCSGQTGVLHVGGDPGGSCPGDGNGGFLPCGGNGGDGSYGAGGFGVGDGFGGDEIGNQGSGGGGGGYGGGAAGGNAGDPGLGGGAYFNGAIATLIGGSTGAGSSGARYDDALTLAGDDGAIVVEITAPP